MYDFAYEKPKDVGAAAAALKGEAKLLAGGQTLIPTLKQRLARPSKLIDLGAVAALAGISVSGNVAKIGAMTRHAAVADNADVKKAIPALAALAGGIGDPQVRNSGTIGGSLANNDPAADYPAAVLGLGATIETNKRKIEADAFFKGMFETALGADEVIVAVHFPAPKRAAYTKFKNPASRYAIVGVFVAETATGVRVAVTGAGPCVFRATALEQSLAKNFSAWAVEGYAHPAKGLNADIHASADYRAHLIGVMAKRAVAAAK